MRILVRFAVIAVFALVVPLAGAATEDSLISAFAGPHNGTLSITGVSGRTKGSFKTSTTNEVGTLTLVSTLVSGTASIIFNEKLSFNKKSVKWTLSEALPGGTPLVALSGIGKAAIKKNVITYKIPLSANGVTGVLSGNIKLATNNHLTVVDTISSGGVSQSLVYKLGGKK